MITKAIARKIHDCYTEIEEATKMKEELKKALNENGEFEIKDNWGNSRGLELHLPTSMSGATIKRVPFQLALDVINSHVTDQENELVRLKTVCEIQIHFSKESGSLFKRAINALDDYLNAGDKAARKAASEEAKDVYQAYHGKEYTNKIDRH
ncbi:MAG: hypothetical protein ACPG5O_04040 [Pseudoalteromonas tetraodonis]